MFYGPAAAEFAKSDPTEIARAANRQGYSYYGVVAGDPWTIRWSQALQGWEDVRHNDPTMTARLLSAARQRKRHLGVLSELGVAIPNHSSFIGASAFEPEATVLYDRVQFVDGTPISQTYTPKLLKRLGSILNTYLEMCTHSLDKQYMSDVFDTGQYFIDAANEAITLIDIEPLLLNLNSQDERAKSVLDDNHTMLEYYMQGELW